MGLLLLLCQTWPIRLWYSYPVVSLGLQRLGVVLFWTLLIGLLTLNFGGAYYLQEGFIMVRRACECDLLKIVSKYPGGEMLSIVLTPDMKNRLSYYWCRLVCNCLP